MTREPSSSILYVDDDRQVASVVFEILSDAGYRVHVATDSEQALQILAVKPVDILLTDIVMPGKNGVDLAQEAKRLRPSIKIMFLTGYAQKAAQAGAMRLGRVFLKPVRGAEIVQTVRSMLVA